MLINLSNHPSAKWSEAQADAAEQFGSCTDLPFPLIDPEAGTDDINSLAAEYLGKILEIGAGSDSVTVHLMGEMTFTCALAGLLRQKGIRCVASTTVRETTDLGNGQKESVFRFVRFRDYY